MTKQPDRELRRLVDGMLENTLTRSEAARLEERMEADPDAMDYYLTMAGQDAMLGELCREIPAEPFEPVSRPKRWWWVAAAAAVAGLAVIIFQPSERTEHAPVSMITGFAKISGGAGITERNEALVSGASLGENTGALVISSGLTEITHRSGTRILIEGPAHYEATGPNAGRLKYGKLVAEVPPGAEGYVVEWSDGKVVDLGTEFAIDVPQSEGPAEVGVFRGEVRVMPGDRLQDAGAPLYTGHAVRMTGGSTTGLRSIPFDQDRFIRQMPSRELPWFYRGGNDALVWDVSHLMWSPGDQLAVFKWMTGPEALTLGKVELLLDGAVVATDEHPCSVGDLSSTVGNVYNFHVGPDVWRRGAWELRAWPVETKPGTHAEGILMFEDGAALEASVGDFTGSWDYVHDGKRYRRAFHSDGTCTLWVDGRASDYFQDAKWEVKGGILSVNFPASKVAEEHLLRDRQSLLFINQPYRNARRGE
jgi:hypothetical protein